MQCFKNPPAYFAAAVSYECKNVYEIGTCSERFLCSGSGSVVNVLKLFFFVTDRGQISYTVCPWRAFPAYYSTSD
jgi:hypothetical protein